ncbi:hypothetical protein CS0771_40510 [Catellatospora sp. IY07-71]|uniref:DUF2637 domain-containing protein n=1 Tax=Catellatospora sp. IY07-71 TaxID=2728827 RepID=UPI001BB309AD|nr:DUF2637 domain-containing protein [Catellatospora sp. IY07-71]BCJ74507.1 hypothetical protein CS0771_40510 [Catellatospora sp. IY07-71]
MSDIRTRGRGWAYAGTIVGGGLSIAANLMHSFVPPADAPEGWTPKVGAVVFSVFWPILLFIAVEILARVIWPEGRWYKVARFGGILPVAIVAGYVSYRHLSALLASWGEETATVYVGPLAIDGLMIMATAALLVIGNNTRTTADTTTTTPAPVPAAPVTPAPATVANTGSGHSPRPPATTQRHDTSAGGPVVIVDPVLDAEPVTVPAHLLTTARFTMNQFAGSIGRPISADELAAYMNVTPVMARLILAELGENVPAITSAHLNGTPAGAR